LLLSAQNEILRRKRGRRTQIEPEVLQGINQKCQQRASELLQTAEQAREYRHRCDSSLKGRVLSLAIVALVGKY
jgi:hypothetical protein